MARPLIALLSDFGYKDHYVGVMKGVILGICPEATLVDISHEIPAHDVITAGFELASVYEYFPSGSIFLVVIDPGVGSTRRGLAANIGDYRFVFPDNGVITPVIHKILPKLVVELTERRYARPTVSRTFEGRDRFAPAAAWLAKGIKLSALGRPADYKLLDLPLPNINNNRVVGQVLKIDRFGNLITNIDRKMFEQFTEGYSICIEVGSYAISRLVGTYADIEKTEVCALFGSTEYLEVASYSASALDKLDVKCGDRVVVSREKSY